MLYALYYCRKYPVIMQRCTKLRLVIIFRKEENDINSYSNKPFFQSIKQVTSAETIN